MAARDKARQKLLQHVTGGAKPASVLTTEQRLESLQHTLMRIDRRINQVLSQQAEILKILTPPEEEEGAADGATEPPVATDNGKSSEPVTEVTAS
jgi:small-conductance mechanosensitive channel